VIPSTSIIAALSADSVIAATATGGLYPYDIRAAGRLASPAAFDADGMVIPALSILDRGSLRSSLDGPAMTREVIHIYAFAPLSDAGYAAVDTLIGRVTDVLHGWQDPVTGAQAFHAGRVGKTIVKDMVFDRLTFSAGSILAVSRW